MVLSVATLLVLLSVAFITPCNGNAAFCKFAVGSIKGTIISNGPSVVSGVQPFSAPEKLVRREYRKCSRSSDPFIFGQNVVVLDMPKGKRVMVDTGAKPSSIFPFWDQTGKMLTNLISAGIQPDTINAILLTHGHADHVNGLVGTDGEAAFPNAVVYIGKNEHNFWSASSPEPSAIISAGLFASLAKEYVESIAPYQKKGAFKVVSNKASPVAGIRFFPTPGHTPGHNSVLVRVGKDVLIIPGDAWISKPDQVRHPKWSFSFDTHPKLGIRSRRKLLRRVAKSGDKVIVFHEEYPGFGRVSLEKGKYDWVALSNKSGGSRKC